LWLPAPTGVGIPQALDVDSISPDQLLPRRRRACRILHFMRSPAASNSHSNAQFAAQVQPSISNLLAALVRRWRRARSCLRIAADTARFRLPLQRVWLQLLGLAARTKSMSKILRFMMRAISSAGSGFWHSERGLSQKFDFGSKAKRSRAFAPRHDSGSVK
jgi:hypothetical protein